MTNSKEQRPSVSDARKIEQECAAELSRLESKRDSLTTQAADLREQVASEAARAQQAESEAAKEFAAAIASGAAPASLEELEHRMAAASAALSSASQKQASVEEVVQALEVQLAALDAAIEEATKRHQTARNAANAARADVLTEQWNALVRKLLPIGAEIDRLLPGDSGWHLTHQMKIPDFNGRNFTRADLLEAGKQ